MDDLNAFAGPRVSGGNFSLRHYVTVLPDGGAVVQTHTADDVGGSRHGEVAGERSVLFPSVFAAMLYATLMLHKSSSDFGDSDGDVGGGVPVRER